MEQQQIAIPLSYVLAVIGTLLSAIGTLFWQLQRKDRRHAAETEIVLKAWKGESTTIASKMTEVVVENKHAIEMLGEAVKSNTRSTDKVLEYLTRALK